MEIYDNNESHNIKTITTTCTMDVTTLRYVPDRTLQKKEEVSWDQGPEGPYSISRYRYQTWCWMEDVMQLGLANTVLLEEEKQNETN
jgi:hypothetical protein